MSDHILDFWENQALEHNESHWASWGDHHAVQLEIENIGQYINQGDDVLDVGCANGFATLEHLEKAPRSLTGIDYSQEMIKQAQKALGKVETDCKVQFEYGDVRNIDKPDNSYDVVYTTRVLINLPTWIDQKRGIEECLRVCKPGGTVILSEAFWEPLTLLNAIRSLKSLPPLVEHDFNRYLKQSYLESFITAKGLGFKCIDFSSMYYIGSRFLREIVTNPKDFPGYSNPINKAFYDLEKTYSGGGFGIQMAYIITKPTV